VAKVSYQWRWLAHLLHDLSTTQVAADLARHLPIRRWSSPGGWLILTVGSISLLYWHGRLVVATGVGVAVMMLVYLLHDWPLERPLAQLKQLFSGWQQPLVLAVAAGGVATLIAYLAVSILADTDNLWLASGAILQGVGTLSVLVLLVWQILNRQQQREGITYNQLLADLTDEDPLRRLIAVRQLTSLVPRMQQEPQRHHQLADYFRLLASREQEQIVREATLEGLHALSQVHRLKSGEQVMFAPTLKQRKPLRARSSLPVS